MEFIDIRQSSNWSKYLELYGWRSFNLGNRSIIRTRTFLKLHVGKLQRPNILKKEDLEEIDNFCKQHRVIYLRLFPHLDQDIDLLCKFKYRQSQAIDIPPTTMLIDLGKDLDVLHSHLSRSCVYSINRSNREGDRVEIFQNPSDELVIRFTELVNSRGKKKGFYTQDVKDQRKKVDVFRDESFIAFAYNSKNELLGAKMYLGFNKNIWYMHGGTTEVGQKSKGGYKLVWDSIVYFKNLGYKYLDLEGMVDDRFPKQTKEWKGYSEFKQKFNGEIVEYPMPYSKNFLPFHRR